MKENSTGKLFIAQSVIDSAYRSHKHNRVAVLWSGGKDSTLLLHMMIIRYGKIPFRVVYGDLNFENRELSEFIDRVSTLWSFPVFREEILSKEEANQFQKVQDKKSLISVIDARYAQSIARLSGKKGIQAFIYGNRRKENQKNSAFVKKTRGITHYFPLLQMSDVDVWEYVYRSHIPFLKDYLRGFRRTSSFMFIRKPSLVSRAASLALHAWFKIKYQFPRTV